MIRIGIIDDEQEARGQLRAELARFEAENGTRFEVYEFGSADAYLSRQTGDCHILYLDIDMPGMTGMELAQKIRETDGEVIIIFCTNLQQFALNGYSVSALGFLVKPVQWYSFHLFLDRALKVLRRRQEEAEAEKRVVIKDGATSKVLCAADIKYVEVRQHYLLYHLRDEASGGERVLQVRGTMQEAAGALTQHGFARCNASYLVNLSHVTAVNRMDVHLGAEVLRIGRTYKDAFSMELTRFLAKRGWES